MSLFLPASLAIVFATSVLAPLLSRWLGERAGWVLALAPLTSFGLLLSQVGEVAAGRAVVYQVDWFSTLGCSFALRLDGLALLMAALVSGIGALIVIYAGGYMKGHPQIGRFYLYLLSFMGSMMGLLVADNLILLFVFWEGTSITSYLLIGFKHEEQSSRWKALQALLVTGLGAMAMLAGFILLAVVTGTYSLSEINGAGDLIRGDGLYLAIVVLVLVGAFTKSARCCISFLAAIAMAAPTPVQRRTMHCRDHV